MYVSRNYRPHDKDIIISDERDAHTCISNVYLT